MRVEALDQGSWDLVEDGPGIELHPQQTLALITEATEALYGGAAGGGKSHFLRCASIIFAMLVPGLQIYLFRRLSDDLIKNHMEGHSSYPSLLAAYLSSGHVKINWSRNFIEFWNGSKIHLCHCQYEKNLTKYQGAQIGLLLIDELTHFTEKMYRYLRGRCRLGGMAVPEHFKGWFPRIICGTNPGSVGHNWVKASFVDLLEPYEVRQMPRSEGGKLRTYIPAKLSDNPTMQETDPDYEATLEGLGSPELVKAMKDGDWNIVAGGMFDDLWREDVHMVDPFPIPPNWTIDRGFDWGSSKPFSVCWFATSDGSDVVLPNGSVRSTVRGDVFLVAEWYGWNGKPNEGLKYIDTQIAEGIVERELLWGWHGRVVPGPADTSIWSSENGPSIATGMAKPVRVNGKQYPGVQWVKADKTNRIIGWQQVRAWLKAALPPGAGRLREQPGLFAFQTCLQYKRTLPGAIRDEKHPEDIDTNYEDHILDVVRYRIRATGQGARSGFRRGV
jgi:hypothetical protein